jgi:hypothetical protein
MLRNLLSRALAVLSLFLVIFSPKPTAASPNASVRDRDATVARLPRNIHLSAAGRELIREAWEAGGLRNNPWAEAVVKGLRDEEANESYGDETIEIAAPELPPIVQALGNDAIVNNRALSTCTCSGRPINQVEPSIAAWGRYALASWNDRRGTCAPAGSPTQSHGWSMDYGATFHEGLLLRGPGANDVFSGVPNVAVDKKTGDFYISGFLRQGSSSNNVGVVAVRGQFGPDSFTIDLRKVITLQATGDFIDQPGMAVDSITGNVYFTWVHFSGADFTTNIQVQRFDRNLDPLGAAQTVTHFPYGASYPQCFYPVVGGDGELYVPYIYTFADSVRTLWGDPSIIEVLRSDDGGLTFGPAHTIANIDYHPSVMPPGFQRPFYFPRLELDIDRTHGPHRGRLYATWTESRPLGGVVFGDTVVNEVEKNDYFKTATPFTPGVRLRGAVSGVEIDNYMFTGQRGQVFLFAPDSGEAPVRVRLLCPSDTTALTRYRLLYGRNANASIGAFQFACGLPYDGTYYLQLESPFMNNTDYRFRTALVPLTSGARARDVRDVFLSYSDDGATWSTPARLDDDDPGFDSNRPQVAVDGRGRVHAFWFDWRGDPECGTSSNFYGVSSGDGGVTWGPNRRLSDASSFWGTLASCTSSNQGEFMGMTAEGDHVYSAFPDTRLGDPDVFVDASVYRVDGGCPPDSLVAPNHDAGLTFTLANGGNFETPLAWQVSNDAGWTTFVSPAPAGQASVAAGGSTSITVNVHAPQGCTRDSTTVRFVTFDPAIPGHADTCVTVVRCDQSVPVLVALMEKQVSMGHVSLQWRVFDATGATATVLRKDEGSGWIERGSPPIRPGGRVDFEERDVPAGLHGYRLVIDRGAEGRAESETWVDVPGTELALEPVHPNPASRAPLMIDFSLPSTGSATIDVVDMAGRRVMTRALGALSVGRHRLALDETSRLRDGIYLVVLRQGGRSISRKAVLAR